ncbi:MAG: YbaK/EbsC family protein [Actinobacteria bacterium]|nr:YbaK/EbsC family protein [Actinomycetota bacterium]
MDGTPTTTPRLSSRERVRAALAAEGFADVAIREFSETTATAAEAAAALGTSVARIVKSLVFVADGRPILVLASGPNRVDLAKVGALIGQRVVRANAEQVRQATGFAIGGVPPVGHIQPLQTVCDQDLLEHDEVWAAAGTPNSVFAIDPRELVRITGASIADVVQRA